MTTREPAWTPRDRAEAMAWLEFQASICPGGCGQPVTESMSHWTVGPEYDARATTCRACAVRAEAQSAEADRKVNGTARMWQVIRLPKEG